MSRSPLAALLCVVPAALSCAVLSGAPAPSAPVAEASAAEEPAAVPDPARAEKAHVAEIRRLLGSRRTALTPRELDRLAHVVVRESKHHEMDPWLVMSVMAVESGFDNFAVSHVGALGLMQVMPATGEELAARLGITWRGPQTLFDPVLNVRMGVAYLRELSDRYGRLSVALAAYNWGPGRIDSKLRAGVPLPDEYVQLVLRSYGVNQQRARRS